MVWRVEDFVVSGEGWDYVVEGGVDVGAAVEGLFGADGALADVGVAAGGGAG